MGRKPSTPADDPVGVGKLKAVVLQAIAAAFAGDLGQRQNMTDAVHARFKAALKDEGVLNGYIDLAIACPHGGRRGSHRGR